METYLDTFKDTWSPSALKAPQDYQWMETFRVPDFENQPKLYLDLIHMDLDQLMDSVEDRPRVWVKSFALEVITLLGTCLSFRKENVNKTTALTEGAKVSDYYVPPRIMLDFVRSLEVVCNDHLSHHVKKHERRDLQDKFQQTDEPREFLKEECGNEHGYWLANAPGCEIGIQTDPLPLAASEEKQCFQSPSPQPITPAPQALSMFGRPSSRLRSPKQLTPAPSRFPTKEPSVNRTPTPKPMSESDSSRHSPRRIPNKPHLVLTRVSDANLMDYRDARYLWDSALDGLLPPSPDLFRASNIHRFRRLGSTGLGICFKHPPTHRQLTRFVASCAKQQSRDAFNRVFRSVSSGGVMISVYDKAHRTPPYPTRLTFDDKRKPLRWSPPHLNSHTRSPQQKPPVPQRFEPWRPPPKMCSPPTFKNAFPSQPHFPRHPHPHQDYFQTQLTQLQHQMHQIMQMQSQLFQQFQYMRHNGF